MKLHTFAVVALALISVAGCTTVSAPASPRAGSRDEAATANLTVGVAYLREQRWALAIEALQRAINIDPRMADAHSSIAIAYDQLGDSELAEMHYERATALDQGNSGAANNYAIFLCRQGRWADAEPYFRQAVDDSQYRTPDIALANAGVCARNAGDASAADAYFREALTRNNTSAAALLGLMDMAFESGDMLRARAFMQRYRASQQPNPQVLAMCIQIENRLGNDADAAACAAQLSARFPAEAEAASL